MSTTPLPLSDIIVVNVSAAAPGVAPRQFNQGLIVGSSAVIPSSGANSRLRQYASTAAMLTDGFVNTDAEYLCAELYFEQPGPPQFVWIGRQDLTAIGTVSVGSGGTGYAVGDIVGVTQVGGSNGYLTVTAVSSGVVTGLAIIVGKQGTGYTVANGLTTTGGTGTGLTVDILTLGESLLEAVEACSLVNQDWYGFMCIGAVDADHLALAAWSTTNWQSALYFGSTADAGVPAGTANNIALQLQTLKDYSFLMYNTTQGGEYPNNIYAAAAVMGLYCGLDTGLAGSYFTLALKTLAGIAPEPLTQTQFSNIKAANCNVCATFGAYSGIVYPGILSSGDYFDQILNRATLVNLIQVNVMNLLISVPAVPQTDAGEHQLIAVVEEACAEESSIGYIAAGTWSGANITFSNGQTAVATGDALPQGYKVVAPPYSTQSAADRAARKAMPIYAAILEAGAVESVTVQVLVEL